jgi:hypothetical protein
MEVTFSVHSYDWDGDIIERGIFLHFGNVRIRVAETGSEFQDFVNRLEQMRNEISDNYKV